MSEDHIRSVEIIPLYRLLKFNEDTLDNRLLSLTDRLERRLFACLSIEEVEAIPGLDPAALEALSKKL